MKLMTMSFNHGTNKWDKYRWFQLRLGRYNLVLYRYAERPYRKAGWEVKVYDNYHWR